MVLVWTHNLVDNYFKLLKDDLHVTYYQIYYLINLWKWDLAYHEPGQRYKG